jgi:NADH dehydrogenase (ubiquinone) 1 alpha subcomplex subunit 8
MSYKAVDSSTGKAYADPTPMPGDVPHVDELGVTSAPLKSAAFFIGSHCKDYNGKSLSSRSP